MATLIKFPFELTNTLVGRNGFKAVVVFFFDFDSVGALLTTLAGDTGFNVVVASLFDFFLGFNFNLEGRLDLDEEDVDDISRFLNGDDGLDASLGENTVKDEVAPWRFTLISADDLEGVEDEFVVESTSPDGDLDDFPTWGSDSNTFLVCSRGEEEDLDGGTEGFNALG